MVREEGIVAASSGSVARQQQSDLRGAEDVLFPLLEGIPVGIFIVRPGGRPYYANREAVRLASGLLANTPGWRRPASRSPGRTPTTRTLTGDANHVVWVKDGAEALDFLFARGPHASRAHADRPRLLLLDIMMPRVDGFEVLRQLRADERFATMPVVIMTSSAEERNIVQGYQLGVNSYVPKPVDFASFQRAVEEVGLYWMLLNKAPGR